jgi:hypothetical protein
MKISRIMIKLGHLVDMGDDRCIKILIGSSSAKKQLQRMYLMGR